MGNWKTAQDRVRLSNACALRMSSLTITPSSLRGMRSGGGSGGLSWCGRGWKNAVFAEGTTIRVKKTTNVMKNKINSHNSRIKNVLRTYENWLYRGEVRLLTDFLEQIRKKGTLSQKQIVTVEKIAKDCEKIKTQPPRIVRG